MNGRGFGVKTVLDAIDKAREVGLHPIKVNTVVQRGVNDHTILDLLRYFKGTDVIVRFIEFMDVGNLNDWKMDQVVPSAELLQRIDAELPVEPVDKGYRGEVADRYRYLDGSGEIGFISSVTEAFLQRLHAGAAFDGREAVHVPVRRRRPPTCAGRCARARPMRSWRR